MGQKRAVDTGWLARSEKPSGPIGAGVEEGISFESRNLNSDVKDAVTVRRGRIPRLTDPRSVVICMPRPVLCGANVVLSEQTDSDVVAIGETVVYPEIKGDLVGGAVEIVNSCVAGGARCSARCRGVRSRCRSS